jgi:hypothetical protein
MMLLSEESRLHVWSTLLSSSACRGWEIINTQFQWDELRLMILGQYKVREGHWESMAFEVHAPCLGHHITGVSETLHLRVVDAMQGLRKEDFGRCTYRAASSAWIKWQLENEPLTEVNYKDRLQHYVLLGDSHAVHVLTDQEPSVRVVFGS